MRVSDLPALRPYGAVLAGIGGAGCGLAGSGAVAAMAGSALTGGPVAVAAAVGLSAVAGRAGCAALEREIASRTAARARAAIRRDLVGRLLSGGDAGAGQAANALLDQVDRIGPYYSAYLPARYLAVVVPALVLAVVFPINWVIGGLLVAATPLIILQMAVFGALAAAVSRKHAAETRRLSGYFLDRLQGLPTLRALGAVDRAAGGVAAASERLAARTMAVLRVAFLTTTALEGAVTLAIAVTATYVGLTLLHYLNFTPMDLREGLFLLLAAPAYFTPLRALAAVHHDRADALAAAETLRAVRAAAPPGPPGPGATAKNEPGPVQMIDVLVRYPGRERPALNGVSAAFPAGSLTAVTGASGAGKSTLLALLAGRLTPTGGTVRAGGRVTWIGQRPYLFPGTIAGNIALGRPAATAAEIGAAAQAARLGHLPLTTELGERGHGISGGEAQRVALARALLAAEPLLLLDEPSAHLDTGTERAVIEVLAGLRGKHTIVVATHSPAVRAICDGVLHLDRGEIDA